MENGKLNAPWYLEDVRDIGILRIVFINNLAVLGDLLLAGDNAIVELDGVVSAVQVELPDILLLGPSGVSRQRLTI